MVTRALKVLVPAAVAIGLLAHSVTGAFASDAVGMTNVTGAAADCSQPVHDGACATLFKGSEVMWPGKPPEQATVGIKYTGSATHVFGVYFSKFASRSTLSGAYCTTADPADKMNLVIAQAGRIVYQGTLSQFAAAHHDPSSVLVLNGGRDGAGQPGRWASGDASSFQISVGLDRSADNPYMSCVTTADIAWIGQ